MSNTENQYVDWLENSITNGHINSYKYSDFKDRIKIGEGSFGDVFRVTWKNTILFALKSFTNDEQTLKQVVKEVQIHMKVNIHSNILRFCGVTSDTSSQTKKYSLVLEFADSDTLKTYLKKHFDELNWDDKYELAFQLASAVECMHNLDIIHCDLHSKNILVHQKKIKLADFGLSRIAEESSSTSKVHGVIPFVDPKSFNDEKNYKLSKKSDVYSIGVLMWQISSGKQPFHTPGGYKKTLFLEILNGKREDIIDETPVAYSNLYKECWKYEPNERPEVQKVVSTLKSIINDKGDKIIDQVNEDIADKSNPLNLETISSEMTANHDYCSMINRDDFTLSNMTNIIDTSENSISLQSEIANVNKGIMDKSNSLNFKKIVNLGEVVGPYLPLIAEVTTLTAQIVKVYESAQYNTKSCVALIERVQAAEVAIRVLNLRKQENAKKFIQQTYYISFEKFVVILREIKLFIQDVTHLSGYKKFISSSVIKERFQQLITDFDNVVGDLQLAITVIANEKKRRNDVDILQEDIEEMTKFLEKIEGGVTTNDKKISDVLEYILVLKVKRKEKDFRPTINEIQPSELTESVESVPAHNNRIYKKRYRGLDVACKSIERDNYHADLAILSNLGKCDYIINFYGLCKAYSYEILGVFEWAENRNLKQLYKNYDIGWPRKLKIALNICRGIIFLHGWCENILITESLEPKISNFKYNRVFRTQDDTMIISGITQIVRWLAPERWNRWNSKKKKDDDYVPYTTKCEIFSFGMLLWELAFQRIPYKNWEIFEIQEHVLNGGRETLNFPSPLSSNNGVEKEFGSIIKAAWQSDPFLRPELSYLFNYLENLNTRFNLAHSPELVPKKQTSDDDDVTVVIPLKSEPRIPDLYQGSTVMPMMKLEVGIAAHKNGEREKAFKCFQAHAEINNKFAKYWLGYYYWEGYVVEKDLIKGAQLFKEAADKGVPDAQLRYAFALSDKNSPFKFNLEEFVKYLTMAADNGNTAARFNLGDLYYNGKLGVSKEQEKGLSYLKLAAIKGQPKACALLSRLNINYFV